MTSTFDPDAKPDMGAGIVITDSNKFSGAGFLDSYTFLIKSCTDIQTADDKDKAALGVAIGLGAFATVVDTVKLAINPLGSLIAAGLGWLIEHVSFLREPLDMLMGDPDQIQLLGEEMHAIAEAIRQVATDQLDSLKGEINHWTGAAADAFNALMQELAADLDSKAHATDIVGYLIHTNMAIISAARALFRDLITTVLGDIISTMLIALALAAFTFGASIVAAVPVIVTQAALTATSMASKSAAIVAQAGRSGGRMNDIMHEMSRMGRVSGGPHRAPAPGGSGGGGNPRPIQAPPHTETPSPTAPPHTDTPPPAAPPHTDTPPPAAPHEGDDPFDTWLAADQHFNGPHDGTPSGSATPHEQTPPAAAPATPSLTDTPPPATAAPATPPHTDTPPPATARPVPWTKTHETWLAQKMPAAYKNYKGIENWLRTEHPDAFKSLKEWVADSDGIKEMWSWPVKAVQDAGKQMLDIEKTAQAGIASEQHP
jgi:hypothetical protein